MLSGGHCSVPWISAWLVVNCTARPAGHRYIGELKPYSSERHHVFVKCFTDVFFLCQSTTGRSKMGKHAYVTIS